MIIRYTASEVSADQYQFIVHDQHQNCTRLTDNTTHTHANLNHQSCNHFNSYVQGSSVLAGCPSENLELYFTGTPFQHSSNIINIMKAQLTKLS